MTRQYKPLEAVPTCKPKEEVCAQHDSFVKVMISDKEGNSAQQLPDGIYVPAIIYRENTVVEAADNSLTVTQEKTPEGWRKFKVGAKVSLATGNILQLSEDGLFVPTPEAPEAEDFPLLVQGSLSLSALNPGQGVIEYTGQRNAIRVTDDLVKLLLNPQEEFTQMEEIYLVQDESRNQNMTLAWSEGVTVDNVAGPGSRKFAAGNSIHLLRHSGQNWLVLSGAGVMEAPMEETPYVRQNGTWVKLHNQVQPVMETGLPGVAEPLLMAAEHFNRIVVINPKHTGLSLRRQYVEPYQDDFEATFVKSAPFTVLAPMGVTVNGIAGPMEWTVDGRPKGCVLKRVGPDDWLLLGAAVQTGDTSGVSTVTTLEWPGSGTYRAEARMQNGKILYDLSNNAMLLNKIGILKNLIIAMVIFDHKKATLTNKELSYLGSYATGLAGISSPLQHGDLISWEDVISLLLVGGYEDIATMASKELGTELFLQDGASTSGHGRFTLEMNRRVGLIESPLVSAFYGASFSVANPVGQTTVYKLTQWLQMIEEDYPEIATIMRSSSGSIQVFGANSRTVLFGRQNKYLLLPTTDFGLLSDRPSETTDFGLVQKLETKGQIPVYIAMLGMDSDLHRHMAYTSALMGLEDQFPFLSGSEEKFDPDFSKVSLFLGNVDKVIDRSNMVQQVTKAPSGFTIESRPNNAWKYDYYLAGSAGWISAYDHPKLRLGGDDFTIEMVFRGAGTKTIFTLFAKHSITGNKRSFWCRVNNANIEFVYSFDGVTEAVLSAAIPSQLFLLNGSRRNLTIQRRANLLTMFLNGRNMAQVDIGGNSFFDNSLPLNIGVDGDPTSNPAPTANQFGLFRLDQFRMTKGLARYAETGYFCETTPFRNGSGS